MFAVIDVPDFALQSVLRHQPECRSAPVVLIDPAIPKAPVVQLTSAARDSGIVEGMTPTQAMARCTGVRIKSRSMAQETNATHALLQVAGAFSPAIESTRPGICTLDLRGHAFAAGSLAEPQVQHACYAFGNRIVEQLALLQLNGGVGIASTPGAALYAARMADPVFLVPNSTEWIDTLPIAAIEPSPETSAILKGWGIDTVGAFTRLKAEQLTARIGPEARVLMERACPRSVRPLNLIRPPELFEESLELEHRIESLEPLLFLLRRFLDQIATRLDQSHWVAEEILLRLHFSEGDPYEHRFRIPAPTSQVDVLFRMLYTHLENFRSEHPIVGLHLLAKPTIASNHQFQLFESSLRDPNRFYETLARLTGLMGSDRVGTPQKEVTHRPDKFQVRPAHFENVTGGIASAEASSGRLGLALRRFRPPLPANVQIVQNRPAFLKTLQWQSSVVQFEGPWHLSGDWWDRSPWAREEWDVQMRNGMLCRIFKEENQWYVDGIYD